MARPDFSRIILVMILCLALTTPAQATSLQTDGTLITVGIVAVSAAVAVLVAVLIIHHKHHESGVAGCVMAGPNGKTLLNEVDKRTYILSGDTSTIKPGERVALEGKRGMQGSAYVFEAHRMTRDFGVCRP